MPIEELQEPIWEKQKGETPNQYCYFLEFLKFPTYSLKDFHKHLCNNYSKLPNITDKAKIPRYETMKNWSSQNKWTSRKETKRTAEDKDIQDTLHELEKQQKIDIFNSKQQIEMELIENILTAINLGQPLSQINQGVQALKTLNEDKQLTQEKPTNYNRTNVEADVKAEAEINREALNMMAKAYARGKDDYLNK